MTFRFHHTWPRSLICIPLCHFHRGTALSWARIHVHLFFIFSICLFVRLFVGSLACWYLSVCPCLIETVQFQKPPKTQKTTQTPAQEVCSWWHLEDFRCPCFFGIYPSILSLAPNQILLHLHCITCLWHTVKTSNNMKHGISAETAT